MLGNQRLIFDDLSMRREVDKDLSGKASLVEVDLDKKNLSSPSNHRSKQIRLVVIAVVN